MATASASVNAAAVRAKTRPFVETKATWAGQWSTSKYLTPIRASRRAAPSMSVAELVWNYGTISREDHPATYRRYGPAAIRDYYVRIGTVGTAGARVYLWTGIIAGAAFEPHGTKHGVSGNQTLTAFGLEHLLDRVVIDVMKVKATDLIGNSAVITLGSTHHFNHLSRWGDHVLGNRTTVVDPTDGVHQFSAEGAAWSNLDILQYLLFYFPTGGLALGLSGEFAKLANITEVHRFEGMTLRAAINRLVDRRRGLGWCIRDDGVVAYIHIFSTFGEPIVVDQAVIQPNPEQVSVRLDQSLDFQQSVVKLHASQQMDRVIVDGDLVEVAWSASVDEGSLAAGWPTATENNYILADDSLNQADPKENDLSRRLDKFEAVYQRFVLSPTWDGTAKDGTETTPSLRTNCIPLVTDDGGLDLTLQTPVFIHGRTLLRSLPDKKDDGNEFRPTVAFIPDPENVGKFIQLDTGGDDSNRPAARLRILDDTFGVLIKPPINHTLGKNHYDLGVPDPPNPNIPANASNYTAIYDWTKLIVTWNMQLDQRLRVVRNIGAGNASEILRVLRIHVEGAKLQYVNPATVSHIEDGIPILFAGGILRDDSARLRLIAGLAAAWYKVPRASIRLTMDGLDRVADVGNYIASIASSWHVESVGTPVTEVTWNFSVRRPEVLIATGFWELDAARAIGRGGAATDRAVANAVQEIREDLTTVEQRIVNLPDRVPAVTSGGAGSPSTLFPPHSHQGLQDGGWAGSFAGTQ